MFHYVSFCVHGQGVKSGCQSHYLMHFYKMLLNKKTSYQCFIMFHSSCVHGQGVMNGLMSPLT